MWKPSSATLVEEWKPESAEPVEDWKPSSATLVSEEPVAPIPARPSPLGVEPSAEDIEKYQRMGVKDYRSPSGKLYDLTEPSPVKPIGVAEQAGRISWPTRMPFSPAGLIDAAHLYTASKRLSENDYPRVATTISTGRMAGQIFHPPTLEGQLQKKKDELRIEDYFRKREEESQRGMTFPAKVLTGASYLPAWMIEFGLTGGLATIGKKATTKAAQKALGKIAATKAGQVAVKTTGWLGGAAARTTIGMPHRVGEAVLSRRLEREPENWATAAAKGWGEVFIEAASETAGVAITKGLKTGLSKLPFGSKLINKLRSVWTRLSPDNTAKQFADRIFTRAGYNGIIGEIGEERLATLMHSIANTYDFGAGKDADFFERLSAGINQDIQNFPVEATVLSLPAVGRFTLGRVIGERRPPTEPTEVAPPIKPLGQIPVAPTMPAEQMREEYRRGELKPAPTIPEPTPTRPVEAITPAEPTVVEAVAEGKAVSELTLGELKQESARFDKKIETEKARLGKIAPERQIFGGTGIENLSPEDAARMTEINDELSRRTKIYKDEAQERVAIKRQLREEGIEFETKDTTENLKAKLHPAAPEAKPAVEKPRQKDLIGRPVLEGGVAGRQAEFLEKEKYRLPEPDIEGQMKIEPPKPEPELGEREAAVVETGIGDKQRSRLIKGIEKQIREHDVYKETLKGLEYKATKIPVGKYYVQTNFKGEVKNAVGNYPGLKFHITYDPHGGKHWDEALMEAGEGGRDIDYFLEQLGQSLEARKTKKGFNVVALEETIERGVPELQILDDIRYGLMEGKSVKEINTNIIEWAKHYDLTETDISDLLIREISDEEIKAEREKAKVEDEALEKLEAERLREKGVKSRQEQERLKGIIARQAVKETEVVAKQKQITKLRHDIHAVAAVKGLTQKALSELKLKHVGYRHLTGRIAQKKITVEQLQNLLKAVQKARPKRVGYKRVITLKTEKKIQSLKENLIKKAQMTEAAFDEVLQKEIQGRQPKYIDSKNFITETQARDILHRMHDTAEVVRITEPYEKAIRGNSNIANEVKILDQKIAKTPKRDPYSLESMRYYNQQAQLKTGAPVFYVYQDLIDTHLENSKTRTATLHKLTTGEFKKITKDKDALQRVSDYIASQSKLKGRPEAPTDITPEEISLAKKIQDILEEYRLKVRTAKFFNWYYYQQPIPDHDRYRKEITKAIDIYDSKGHDALIEYLKTQEWGVIKSGYEPLEVLFQKIRPYRMKPTTVGKGHIKIRTDIEYHPQERTILQRLSSYMRQMDMLSNLSPKINAYVRLYDDNMSKFNKPEIVRQNTELFLQNLKRYNIQRGWFERQIARAYSQAMRVIIMPSPVLAFRNLFQNAAFEHDKSILIDPRNKKLTDEDIDYLETYVLQTRMMVEEYFMVGEKPYLGLRFLTKVIDKIKIYAHSDIVNRHWGFWAKINQVRRAQKEPSIKEMMQQAKFKDMTELEQRWALGLLAKDGKGAMARYVARAHVNDVHFLYERSQRSPAEMGGVGRIIANLMLFPRAYTEKLAHATSKMMNKKSDFPTRYRGLKILFAVIAGGMLCGAMYRKVTGRRRNPYDPLELLRYEAGGLAWGAVESANQVYINILLALKGDSRALAALTTAIPEAADMFIPFYNYVLRGIEAATDQKNVDRKVLRQLRMLINKEYKIRGGAYKLERKTLEKWQYFIAGAGVDVEIKERQKKEKPAGRIKPMQKIQRIKRVR